MTMYTYKNPGKKAVWVGDICIPAGGSITASAYKPDLEPLVGQGILTKKVVEKADKHPGEAYLAKKLGEKGASAETSEDEIVEDEDDNDDENDVTISPEVPEDEIVDDSDETEEGVGDYTPDQVADNSDED